MLISTRQAKHRIIKMGQDSTGLERWSWTLYQDKQNSRLRVILAYQYRLSSGLSTVLSQQRCYFDTKNDNKNKNVNLFLCPMSTLN